jgi:hypothetical protein
MVVPCLFGLILQQIYSNFHENSGKAGSALCLFPETRMKVLILSLERSGNIEWHITSCLMTSATLILLSTLLCSHFILTFAMASFADPWRLQLAFALISKSPSTLSLVSLENVSLSGRLLLVKSHRVISFPFT